MNKERILRLADHMETVDKRKYLQSRWLDGIVSSRTAIFDKVADKHFRVTPKEGFCGTAACVLGHAAMIPDMGVAIFAEAEYVLVRNGRRESGDFGVYSIDDKGHPLKDKHGDYVSGFDAGMQAMGISAADAEVIFGSTNHQTKAFYLGCRTYQELLDKDGISSVFHEVVTPAVVAAALRRYVETDGASMIDHENFWGE